jgi:hypothetical protein
MMEVVAVILGLWWYDTEDGGCGGDLGGSVCMILMIEIVAVILGLWWSDTEDRGCGGDLGVVVV